jgi:chlorite dismutase
MDRYRQQFCDCLNELEDRSQRLQSFIISGHKADFGLILMDPDPLRIDRIHQRLMATSLGQALIPTYSFVSMSEVSEYLPDKDGYAAKLIRSGEDPGSPAFQAKVSSYERRLPVMLAQRLAPEFPTWPAMCFYPMNKVRHVGANWYLEPFSARTEMMAEHAQSGMAFAGRVTQLVTASVGLDDWEWGVTLWARNPQFLKEIVYTMRYDSASARFGQFGEFYVGYLASPESILEHCCIR